jgi:tight adherence protein B
VSGDHKLFIILLGITVVLLLASVVSVLFVLEAHDRENKFKSRVQEAVAPTARHPNPVEEELALTRTVSRSQQLKENAARFIGVDLQQAETYPIKWWLVPPLTLLLDLAILFIASHPLGKYKFLLFIVTYLGGPVLWLVLTKFVFNWFTNRRNAKLLEQFPDALNTIVRCVRVGIPMGEALRTVARDAQEPTKAEFTILADKVSIGIPLDIALRELSLRIKLTEYQFFSTALTLQARSGGGITQTLETLAEVIRKRVGLKARGYALTAEARMSSYILSVLPFVAGGAIFVMQRAYMMTLFTTSGGESVLGAAILLMCTGMGIIQFMISNVLK